MMMHIYIFVSNWNNVQIIVFIYLTIAKLFWDYILSILQIDSLNNDEFLCFYVFNAGRYKDIKRIQKHAI